MKFGHIELFVKDVTQSKDFYCNILGFELVSDQGEFIWIKLDTFEILLRKKINNLEIPSYQKATHGIVFYSENLEKIKAQLQQKGLKFKGYDNNPSCVTFTDLDDHWFQLVDPKH